MRKFNRLVNWGLTPICLLAALLLSACAGLVPDPNHSFDFRPLRDSPSVRVLDWRYGELRPLWPVQSTNPDGDNGASTSGRYPVGDYIYLKWQVPPSPQIFERKIELKGLLPFSMEGREIRIIFENEQPVVYLISPDDSQPNFVSFKGRGYSFKSIKQIYPPIGK